MFKRSYNRAVLHIEILTISPLLIKSGDAGMGPTAAQLACVRTRHASAGPTVYIPGSGLRGVLRSVAEASLRDQSFSNKHGPIDGADDPLTPAVAPRRNDDDPLPTATIHRGHALTSRLFGSTQLKSRCAVRDLFPWPGDTALADIPTTPSFLRANRTELRNNVAIDQLLGSVKHGPWDSELVPAGVAFWGDIALENYEVWQLGLLIRALDEFNEGFAQLGSGKSRGLGVVRIAVKQILHEQPARAGGHPYGVAHLADANTRRDYDLFDEAPNSLPATPSERRGLHDRFTVNDTAPWLDAGRRALQRLEDARHERQ